MAGGDRLVAAARAVNPFLSSPAGPLETIAWLDSFEPSLMPRTSLLQGAVGGLSVLAARAVTGMAERVLPLGGPDATTTTARLGRRALLGLVGSAVARVPPVDEETLWRAGIRTTGRLLQVSALGGAVHGLGDELRERWGAPTAARPLIVTAATLAGVGVWAQRRLRERTAAVEPWPVEQRTTLPQSVAGTVVVTGLGAGLTRAFVGTRDAAIAWLGPGPAKQVLARGLNAGLWTLVTVSGYQAGVAWVGRANERVEPGYAVPPATPHVSGSPHSTVPFEDLGLEGRHFVVDTVTPQLIAEVLGEPAAAHPIRVFVGFDSEPLYQAGRAELALEELERTGAYDRRYLLLASPTGTGWVDQTMIETAELLTRGDIATACVQYGRFPSFLSLQKVALGRGQFRLLLMGVRQRIRALEPARRPRVLVFGESLGAWSSSDVIMDSGIAGFDHYGIDRALWVGLPGLAKWSRNNMTRGSSALVPQGTVRVVDRPEQLEALTEQERARLRAVILSHDNDPIAQLVPDLLVRRPDWLATDRRGRGVPSAMRWRPLVTFLQTAVDAANAMVLVPGAFASFGHDYRADMARVVRVAFDLPAVSDEIMGRVESTLRRLEVDRAERMRADTEATAPPAPTRAAQTAGGHRDGRRPTATHPRRPVAAQPLTGGRRGRWGGGPRSVHPRGVSPAVVHGPRLRSAAAPPPIRSLRCRPRRRRTRRRRSRLSTPGSRGPCPSRTGRTSRTPTAASSGRSTPPWCATTPGGSCGTTTPTTSSPATRLRR